MLLNPSDGSSPVEGPCPPAAVWWEIAAGTADQEQASGWLQHAASCPSCARELSTALEPAPVEQKLSATRLDRPAARRSLAEKMAKASQESPKSRRKSRFWGPFMAAAAVLTAVAVGAGYWFTRPSAAQLIAQAYGQERTVELRIPGANHGPMRLERAAGQKMPRSAALLDAELRVVSGLDQDPESPTLLDLRGRIALLRWDYTSALADLTRAQEIAPESLETSLDLASAYFERGEQEQQPADYGRTVELLSRVLAKRPQDGTALFNRAIVQERLRMYREARADWEKYLQLDTRGAWADEARERLAAIRKISQDKQGNVRPCSTLTAGESLTWGDDVPRRLSEWEGSWECLREHALTEWLPGAALGDRDQKSAFVAAAQAFRTFTGDTFLFDLMEGSTQPQFAEASRELAASVRANLMLESGRAEVAAQRANRLFQNMGNKAGEWQALRELAYVARRFQNGKACRKITDTLPRLPVKRWPWLAAQLQLETGACSALLGDYVAARRAASAVVADTDNPALASLRLRAHSYLESYGYFTGEFSDAWNYGARGLEVYWGGNFQHVWAYQLYYNLAAAALKNRQYHLATGLQHEALAEIELSGRPSLAAFTWFDYGRTALLAGEIDEARQAFAVSATRFAEIGRDPAVAAALVECEIHLAEIENLDGHPTEARRRLEKIAEAMKSIHQISASLRYGRALAEADRLLHAEADYLKEIRGLVNLAELGVASSPDFGAQTQWLRDTSDIYRGLVEVEVRGRQARKALDDWEWTRAAPFRAGRGGTAKPEALDVAPRAELPHPGSATEALARSGVDQALIYASIGGRVVMWRIRGTDVSMHISEAGSEEIDRLAREIYALCSSPHSSEERIKAVSEKLSAGLIRPIEGEVAWSEPLSVELDDSLALIPFAVLRLRSGEFVGERCPLAMFPAAAYLVPRRASQESLAGGPILAVGVSTVRGMSTAPLQSALDEITDATPRFASSRILLNDAATLAAIKREIGGAVVFQFAGHSRNAADRAALLIAGVPNGARNTGVLEASDILTMNLSRCRLAIISTCSGEAPDLFQESRPYGFALALLRQGVPAVLTTRWNLDSTAGARFVGEFYQHLFAGQPAARAMQSAAAALRREKSTRHPYFWAAYQFFGSA